LERIGAKMKDDWIAAAGDDAKAILDAYAAAK
jgi:hypothetical protein